MEELLKKTKIAQRKLASLTNKERNQCLRNIASIIIDNGAMLLDENQKDIIYAKQSGLSASMIERLTLSSQRIYDISSSIIEISKLEDDLNQVIEEIHRPNGLLIQKIRVPFGVIGVIFEARPNVALDIAALTIKTGNACVLKGGKEAINTNRAVVSLIHQAIRNVVDENCVSLIDSTSRSSTDELITKKGYIDLLIPRGSKNLIQYVVNNAKVPYIETGAGNCHLYVHEDADIEKAINIAINAKYQRPSVCNAIETIVVDQKIAGIFLPRLYQEFSALNIEMRGDEKTREIIPVLKASEEDFYTEYNDYICAIKTVRNLEEAIDFINEHSTKHSEAIITENKAASNDFMANIDSACVYVNASTRFSDGGEFGFGAEIGISTSKLHARGPMGLKEITTYKYLIYGNGQVRK